MFISVEISTYNRWPILKEGLDRLAEQTYPRDRFEVVISDDNSSEGMLQSLRRYASQAPYRLRVIENATNRGCGENHNTGIRAAAGHVVLMLADDVWATPGVLEEHARLHERHPEPNVGVVGRLAQSPDLPRTPFQRAWDPIVDACFPRERVEVDYRDFWVNNLSFKRDFMLKHGMFRAWPVGAHEDVELGYRLQRKGMRLLFCDAALAYHHHPETIDSVARRSYAQGYNWENFETHVPERWVRLRSGNFRSNDGLGARIAFHARLAARTALFNGLTVPRFVVPAIRAAQTRPALVPLLSMSVGKVASYYFRRGVLDRRSGQGSRFEQA